MGRYFISLLFLIITFLGVTSFNFTDSQNYDSIFQDEISLDQKMRRLKNALRDLKNLSYSQNQLDSEINPMIQSKTDELAPHYPDVSNLTEVEADQKYKNWIVSFSEEHKQLLGYLESFIRSHY